MAMETPANVVRPTRFQITLALLVMLVATVEISLSAIAIEESLDRTSQAVFYAGFGLLLLVTQYGGTFRRWKMGTLIATGFLTYLFIGSSLGLIWMMVWICIDPTALTQWQFFLVCAVLSPLTAWGIQVNLQWHQTLKKTQSEDRPLEQQKSFTLLELLGAMFVLGCVIGPVSYQANTNQSLYLEDVPRSEVPFAVSPQADQIKFRRERDGTIRGYWIEGPSIVADWIQKQKTRPEVTNFSLETREDAEAIEPIADTKYEKHHRNNIYWELKIATWQVDNRRYEVRWAPFPELLETDVYYFETEID